VKACPTCGREIPEAASACETCEAWAAALAEPRPDDSAAPAPAAPAAGQTAPTAAATEQTEPAAGQSAPAAAAAKTAVAERPASQRRLALIAAAGIAAVGLTGFAISARGGSAPVPSAPSATPGPASLPAAAVKPAASTAPALTASSGVQTWNAENRAAWVGNRRRGAAFELLSENVVKTWLGPARPSLVIRCTAQTIDAFVITGSPLRIVPKVEGKTVTMSVDGEPMRSEQWMDADDRTAVFAPDAAAFVQRLLSARTLHFGYSPHGSSDVVAQFNVAGLDALISGAAKECGANPRR